MNTRTTIRWSLTSTAALLFATSALHGQDQFSEHTLIGADSAQVERTLGRGQATIGTLFNEEKSVLHSGRVGEPDAYESRIGYFGGKCCYAFFKKTRGTKFKPAEVQGLLYLCSSRAAWEKIKAEEGAAETQFIYQPKTDKGAVAGRTLFAVLWHSDASLVVYSPEWRPIFDTDFRRRSMELEAAGDLAGGAGQLPVAPAEVEPRDPVIQVEKPDLGLKMAEAFPLIHVKEAREKFGVSGKGLAAVVLDTGLRASHVDFQGRVLVQRNFTPDNGGASDNASDGDGHGTNVTGIIAASGIHKGVAPDAGIIPVKVLANDGGGNFRSIRDGLRWVLANLDLNGHRVGVVNMSLGDGGNYTRDRFAGDEIKPLIASLRAQGVAVVVAAGNDFHEHRSAQGMGYPAIFQETVSVGAVYDSDEGPFQYGGGRGATAFSTRPNQITPFSQRLHPSMAYAFRTDIFAPGAPITSSGILSDEGVSVQHGTSQAAPVTSGVILLVQEYYKRATGVFPTVDQIESWLRESAVVIRDDYGDQDNVENTDLDFPRIDAEAALASAKNSVERLLLERTTEGEQ